LAAVFRTAVRLSGVTGFATTISDSLEDRSDFLDFGEFGGCRIFLDDFGDLEVIALGCSSIAAFIFKLES